MRGHLRHYLGCLYESSLGVGCNQRRREGQYSSRNLIDRPLELQPITPLLSKKTPNLVLGLVKRSHCLTKLGLTAKDTDTIGLATQEFFERLLAERSVDPEVRFGRRARAPAFEAERPTAVY